MATYQVKVEDLIGSVGDTAAISDFCTDTARELVNIAPKDILHVMAEEIDDSGSGATLSNAKFLYAKKDGYEAPKVEPDKTARYTDSNSIYYATTKSPICYILKNKAFVKPSGGQVFAVKFPTIAFGDSFGSYASSGTVVAQELEPIILLGAAVKGRLRQLADKRTSLPTGLVFPSTPSVPSLSANQIGTLGTAPVYTAPKVGGATEELTATIEAATAGEATDKYDFSRWFDLAADYIEDEEDVELANAQLQKIQTYIQTYSTQMQDNLNDFQKEQAEYQSKTQEAIQQAQINAAKAQSQAQIDASKVTTQAQLDAADAQQTAALLLQKENQEYAAKLQQFSSDLGKYSAEVQAKVQDHTAQIAEISAEIQKDSTEYNWISQRYAALKGQYDQAFGLMAPKEGQD